MKIPEMCKSCLGLNICQTVHNMKRCLDFHEALESKLQSAVAVQQTKVTTEREKMKKTKIEKIDTKLIKKHGNSILVVINKIYLGYGYSIGTELISLKGNYTKKSLWDAWREAELERMRGVDPGGGGRQRNWHDERPRYYGGGCNRDGD